MAVLTLLFLITSSLQIKAQTINIIAEKASKTDLEHRNYSSDEIMAQGHRELGDFLDTVAGLEATQDGIMGPTTVTSLGGQAADTKVYIDGVLANDPSSINEIFDFSTLPIESVKSLKVKEGGVLDGGTAIYIQTHEHKAPVKNQVKTRAFIRAEYPQNFQGGLSATTSSLAHTFMANYANPGSIADSADGHRSERDTRKYYFLNSSWRKKIGKKVSTKLEVRMSQENSTIDSFLSVPIDDPNYETKVQTLSLKGRYRYELSKKTVFQAYIGKISTSRDYLNLSDTNSPFEIDNSYKGTRNYMGLNLNSSLSKKYKMDLSTQLHLEEAGLKSREKAFGSESFIDEKRFSGHLETALSATALGLKYDTLLRFRKVNNFDISADYRASVTTPKLFKTLSLGLMTSSSYRAPTLYQAYSIYGSNFESLEKIQIHRASLKFKTKMHSAKLSYSFYKKTDLISYEELSTAPYLRYINEGETRSKALGLNSKHIFPVKGLDALLIFNQNMAWSRPIDTAKKTRRPRTSNIILTQGLTLKKENLSFAILHHYKAQRLSNSSKKLRPFSLFSLKAAAKITKKQDISLSVGNALNHTIRGLSGLLLPRRTYGLKWTVVF